MCIRDRLGVFGVLIKCLYGVRYTDLGPFRAIRYPQLLALNMQDKTFGWTVEMQLKAAKQGIPVCEIPVRYRKRIGVSKITGTFTGTLKAGYKILTTLIYHRFLAQNLPNGNKNNYTADRHSQ